MIERNKYIYLRYKIKKMSAPSAPTAPVKPKQNDYITTGPDGKTKFIDKTTFNKDNDAYNKQKASFDQQDAQYKQDNPASPSIQEITETPEEALKLFANKISYTLPIGTQTIFGLTQADMVHWYMKPVNIKINGTSLVSNNPMLDSDNLIVSMVKKLQKYLSEETYNYFQKPQFVLYVENGVPGMDAFIGVISSIDFNENADYPDKFEFNIDFTGKPYNMNVIEKASQGFASDLVSTSTNLGKTLATNSMLNILRKV